MLANIKCLKSTKLNLFEFYEISKSYNSYSFR